MPNDQLTARERATLLVLLAEGRKLTNAQMKEVAGFTLDGEPRRRLVERKLITSEKKGRGNVFELTEPGAAWCRDELTSARPPRAGYLGGALYAVLSGLQRNGTPLSELFAYRPDVEEEIRRAYAQMAAPGEWVGLNRLREELGGVGRDAVDAELERLASTPGVHVQAEPNQKALTDADRAASVRFGGDDRHMIMIEAG